MMYMANMYKYTIFNDKGKSFVSFVNDPALFTKHRFYPAVGVKADSEMNNSGHILY